MDDATFEAQQARIRLLVEAWQFEMALNLWEITHYYVRDLEEMPNHPANMDALAVAKSEWQYLHATVHWNIRAVEQADDEQLERVFVHELMHIHLTELRPLSRSEEHRRHEERVASELARSFMFIRDATRKSSGHPQPD